jgi:heterodisulfide reductase subunit C
MKTIVNRLRYNKEIDKTFVEEIKSMPGCEALETCIQCGTCSGTCPLSIYMDYTPRQIIYLTRAGFKDDVLKSLTIWLCASCYSCTVECPKNIKVTDVMYALKQRAIKDKVYSKRFPIPSLARIFFEIVRSRGRVAEGQLVIKLFLKTSKLELMQMSRLGWNLLRTGRLSLRSESIRKRDDLKKMLDSI